MADEEFGGVEDEGMGSSKKPMNLKLIIIVVVVAGIMGAGGFFAGKILTGKGGDAAKQEVKKEEPAKKEEGKTETKVEPVKENGGTENKGTENTTTPPSNTNAGGGRGILALEPFTVNLNDPFGRRYLEAELKLVVDKKELIPKIKDNELIMPKIRNEILMVLSSKSYNDLRTVAGKVTMKEEIQMRVNEVLKQELGVEPVVEVLETKFIMQ